MGEPLIGATALASLDEVRRYFADLVIGDRPLAETTVGDIDLWPHQRDAVARLRAAIGEFGGALLADDVGTGKTFVALAIASRFNAPLVVAPAALRESWRTAATRVGRVVHFVSFESLSRGRRPGGPFEFVIVDEAHHARNPATRRYGALAAVIAGTPVLLLSATPIHNRRDDLIALLGLFLGSAAASLNDAALSRCVIRRARSVLAGTAPLPEVRGPFRVASDSADDLTPDAILALPPPVPASDAGTAGALVAVTLLRQWASSQGALLAGIRRRLAAAHALGATLDDGRYPTRAELAAWTLGDDAQQLAMTAILSPESVHVPPAALRAAVAAHVEGLRMLCRTASADPDLDRRRALRLRELWQAHPGARSIAFSQFAETIDAYWRQLREVPAVCAVTARGARIASGAIPRAEALGSFAPGRSSSIAPSRRITALLTTDLASEGLDLQDASLLVHLDLPWTPARLEQRLGRVVRPGSPHPVVYVYMMDPPLRVAARLDIRRRLTTKLAAARDALGAVMPDVGIDPVGGIGPDASPASASRHASSMPSHTPTSPAASGEQLVSILDAWRRLPGVTGKPSAASTRVLVATGTAPIHGWLAVVGAEHPRLVAACSDRVGDDPALIVQTCALIDRALPPNGGLPADAGCADAIGKSLQQLSRWLDTQRAARLAGVGDIPLVRNRRSALAGIARLADAPASERARLATSSIQALTVASRRLDAASERLLRQLTAGQHRTPATWLDALGAIDPTRSISAAPQFSSGIVRALLVVGPQL